MQPLESGALQLLEAHCENRMPILEVGGGEVGGTITDYNIHSNYTTISSKRFFMNQYMDQNCSWACHNLAVLVLALVLVLTTCTEIWDQVLKLDLATGLLLKPKLKEVGKLGSC
jgi:hypothetical protein